MKCASLILLAVIIFIGLLTSTLSNPDGFLNINCGASGNITDSDFDWISDSPYIKSRNVSSRTDLTSTLQYQSLAYFTSLAEHKYCYLLPVELGKLYLVRARFSSAAFQTDVPFATVFDLLIEGTKWTKVFLHQVRSGWNYYHEIILTAKRKSFSVCLARNSETENNRFVFISTIEVRPLKSAMYSSIDFEKKALDSVYRRKYGSSTTDLNYPEDPFDRIWNTWSSTMEKNSTAYVKDICNGTAYSVLGKGIQNEPPMQVLRSAITTALVDDMLVSDQLLDVSGEGTYYFALYFCNINPTMISGIRSFQVYINSSQITELQFSSLCQCRDVYSILEHSNNNTIKINLRRGKGSDMGPFINAAEVYEVLDLHNMTHPDDVLAIKKIAEAMNVPDDWVGGDPCLPAGYSSTGVICSQDNPPRVIILNLTNMGLIGTISPSIRNLRALNQLLLGNNSLSGSIPDLGSLKNLTTLQLQNNQLTGDIPRSLEKLPLLNQLFLQNNNLNGVVPPGLIKPGLHIRFHPQGNFSADHKGHKLKGWRMGVLIGCLVLLIEIVIFVTHMFIRRHKHRLRAQNTNCPIVPPQHSSADEDDKFEYYRLAVEYSEEDIKAATNNYSTIVGKGGFGSVFYGKLSGYDVAVKILSPDSNQGPQEFQNELTLLSRIYHKNLVNLVGYCKKPIVALIYEYMHCGTLKDHLYGLAKLEKALDWHTRLNIALQAAEGLLYLHQGCNPPIIHRDIKCTNILLDRRMFAKLADFGLTKLLDCSQSYVLTNVKGTPGYLDPEYFETGSLNEKSDVYSFGVVLMEIISGTSPKDGIVESAQKLLSCGRIEDLVDPSLEGQYNLASAWKVAEIAYTCVEPKSINRPKMNSVVKELEEAVTLAFQDSNQSEYLRITSLNVTEMPSLR